MVDENIVRSLATQVIALAELNAGLVVDGESVMDWIASWGTAEEKEPPK